jgi:hypothetical protein
MVGKFTSLPFDSPMADTPFNHELSPLGMQSRRRPSIFNPIRNWLLCLLYVHLIPVAVQAQDRQLFYCADIYRTVLIIEKYIMIVCNSLSQITRLVHYTTIKTGGCEYISDLHDEQLK